MVDTDLTGLALFESLGQGASGRVFRGKWNDQDVAVKCATSPQASPILVREARALLQAQSRTLPRLHAVGHLPHSAAVQAQVPPALPCLVLEYTHGLALDAFTKQNPAVGEGLGHAILRDAGEAVAALHESGLAHGDVKPSNILVTTTEEGDYQCRIIDLGLAQAKNQHSLAGATPRYLAPEVLGAGPLGSAATRDLWALGVSTVEALVQTARTESNPRRFIPRCPTSLQASLQALLAPNPTARPRAAWLVQQYWEELSEDQKRQHNHARIRRTYLRAWLRTPARDDSGRARLTGPARLWVEEHLALTRQLERLAETSVRQPSPPQALSSDDQRLWLASLLGPPILSASALPPGSDAEWIARLLDAGPRPLEGLDLQRLHSAPPPSRPSLAVEELALALGAESPSELTLQVAERKQNDLPVALRLAAAQALKRRTEYGRALAMLAGDAESLRLEHAGVSLRAGDHETAETLCTGLLGSTASEIQSGAAATLSRSRLGLQDVAGAAAALQGRPPSAELLEAQASLELTRGQLDAAERTLSRCDPAAQNSEQQARISALRAHLAQRRGAAANAQRHFAAAASSARRCGAVLEEATYLTGVASAASSQGLIEASLTAAVRAQLLFIALDRGSLAARAGLNRASSLAVLGAFVEAQSQATAALQLAKQCRDSLCEAYLHLVLADIAETSAVSGHLTRAGQLLEQHNPLEMGRVLARRCRAGELSSPEIDQGDLKADDETNEELVVEWWGARAQRAYEGKSRDGAPKLVRKLLRMRNANVPTDLYGAAMAYGSLLATRTSDGDAASVLREEATRAVETLRAGCPVDLRSGLEAVKWVDLLSVPEEAKLSPEQLKEIERLVESLSHRDSLRTLFDRVLDALVRWTGVERGLLLLKAPGDKLVPRAARNLARENLSSQQLTLSRTLAQQALNSGECIVAVDASGELPDIHESVHALKLRSVLAVPLIAHGDTLGVVYLDDRVRKGAFGQRELAWVQLVASVAAVAISEARDQLLLRRTARRARRAERRLELQVEDQRSELELAQRSLAQLKPRRTHFDYDDILGESDAMRKLLSLVDRVATADVPVLLHGESGSGKELIARAIHDHSSRRGRPFVSENCAAIPDSLLESTLFGHVRGAFTDAGRGRQGLFEAAHGGTLLLDEIGEMSLAMQAKLLRVLQDGQVRKLGAERTQKVSVRVIGATHRDLGNLVEKGEFRQDLWFRLNVVTLELPPLRRRRSDIPLLATHFLQLHSGGRLRLTQSLAQLLSAYDWPGNVRELENEIRRAVALAEGELGPEDFSERVRAGNSIGASAGSTLKEQVNRLERDLIERALGDSGGNQTRAAKELGISRFGLQKMIKRLEIRRPQ